VADRVRGDPPAGPVRGDDRVGETGGVGLQVPPVSGVTVHRIAGVGGGHGGGAADERAVGEDLHRAQAQPVVAEAGPQAQVDASVDAVGWVRAEGMEDVADHHQLDPDVKPALIAGGDVGGELNRGLTDPAAADTCLGDRGDALRQVAAAGRVDGVGQDGQRVGVSQVPDQFLGAFFE
jgi:hypothetical protein